MENVNDVKWLKPSLTWLGHASFSFVDEKGNRVYYVDPFSLPTSNGLPKGDLIFITHAHSDHFSQTDIQKIIKDDTVIIAPPDILEKVDISQNRKLGVEPLKDYEIKGFKFSTIPAYNNHPQKLNFHPKSNNWVGYIFNLNDKKIYHAGDTDFIEDMRRLKSLNLDVAMLPMGGTYTMDVTEAAAAANAICAKITIPMHYKSLLREKSGDAEEKFKALVTNSKVVILKELT